MHLTTSCTTSSMDFTTELNSPWRLRRIINPHFWKYYLRGKVHHSTHLYTGNLLTWIDTWTTDLTTIQKLRQVLLAAWKKEPYIHVCSDKNLDDELRKLQLVFQTNGFPSSRVQQTIRKKNTDEVIIEESVEKKKTLVLPYVKGLSEKITKVHVHVCRSFDIWTAFSSKPTLCNILTRVNRSWASFMKFCVNVELFILVKQAEIWRLEYKNIRELSRMGINTMLLSVIMHLQVTVLTEKRAESLSRNPKRVEGESRKQYT